MVVDNITAKNKRPISTNSIIITTNLAIIKEMVLSPISEDPISNLTKDCRNNHNKQATYNPYIGLIKLPLKKTKTLT